MRDPTAITMAMTTNKNLTCLIRSYHCITFNFLYSFPKKRAILFFIASLTLFYHRKSGCAATRHIRSFIPKNVQTGEAT